jgi:hypothetical protein
VLYSLFVLYFSVLGAKLDKTKSIAWVILFIPVYIFEFPLFIFACLHWYSLFKASGSFFATLFSTFSIISKNFLIEIFFSWDFGKFSFNTNKM